MILCFRAQQKIEIVKDADGKTQIVPKRTLTGLDGWIPISEKTLPYELTASSLLTASMLRGAEADQAAGAASKSFFPLDKPISEEAGKRLAEWAAGKKTGPAPEATVALRMRQLEGAGCQRGQHSRVGYRRRDPAARRDRRSPEPADAHSREGEDPEATRRTRRPGAPPVGAGAV